MRTILVVEVLAALTVAPAVRAQSLLYRSPNLSGDWVPDAGVVQFNFIHRFTVTSDASHTFINSPTFTFAAGIGQTVGVGYRFATKSAIARGNGSNESEVFARWRFWGGREGTDGLHAALTPAYNFRAGSLDGEVAADYSAGPLTVLGAARALGSPFGARGARAALAGGAVIRVNQYIALAGDFAKLLGGDTTAAWSAGIHVQIPNSPHTFALEVSNVTSNTLQGSSRGLNTATVKRLYGFEFTIPLHLSRFGPWFHASRGPALGVTGQAAAEVRVSALAFPADTTRIAAGQIVRWINQDPLDHSVSFEVEGPPSGPLPAKGSYAVKFDRPGIYPYHCTPHPFMKGVVVVR